MNIRRIFRYCPVTHSSSLWSKKLWDDQGQNILDLLWRTCGDLDGHTNFCEANQRSIGSDRFLFPFLQIRIQKEYASKLAELCLHEYQLFLCKFWAEQMRMH